MGLLDALKQYVIDAMPGGLLNPEIGQAANETANNIRAKGKAFERGLLDPNKYAGEALQAGLDMAGMAPLGLTVWHGSPHKFSKFDMSKIGTGEGAQAYGHGLYMAESPEVAKSYKDALQGGKLGTETMEVIDDVLSKQGRNDLTPYAMQPQILDLLSAKAGKGVKEMKFALGQLKNSFARQGFDWQKEAIPKIDELIKNEDLLNAINLKVEGQLYKVDIPDEAVARFLDWDKPLSQQAPEVQKALDAWRNEYIIPYTSRGMTPMTREPDTGKAFYQALNSDKGAADFLKEHGVTGIRYLDGGSRSAGQGSSNFVLFDDQLPRILETNGVPTGLQPWKPGEWGLLK